MRKVACLATLTAYEVATPPMRDILPRLKWVPWPGPRTRKRWWRSFNRSSPAIRAAVAVAAAAVLALAINGIYQVIRKPSELLFPVSGTLYKTPAETWRQYAPLFRAYATDTMTPDLLAAIAQIEGSGNPIVRTYWRWTWSLHPFSVYRPASSAVGMYQMTDGTFAEARRYCIHDHVVVEQGRWDDRRSCWFNALYSRLIPAHAVELTSADLDRGVSLILARQHLAAVSLEHKQALAAVIHLCGAGAGDAYARRGFRLAEGQRCGDHRVSEYLSRINAMRLMFDRLAADRSAGQSPLDRSPVARSSLDRP